MYAPRFGLSASVRPEATPAEMLAVMRKHGLSACELNLEYLERHGTAVSLFAAEAVALGFHLPFDAEHRVLSGDAAVDAAHVLRLQQLMARAAALGCTIFTLHVQNIVGQTLAQLVFGLRLGVAADLVHVACPEHDRPGIEDRRAQRGGDEGRQRFGAEASPPLFLWRARDLCLSLLVL